MARDLDGDVCPTCNKPYATEEAGEMSVDDRRVAEWCWTNPDGSDECDGEGEIKRHDFICAVCGKLTPHEQSADDGHPDWCDACWIKQLAVARATKEVP